MVCPTTLHINYKKVSTQKRTKVKDVLLGGTADKVIVKGWVRTKRQNKNVAFIALNDGSTINNLQLVADPDTTSEDVLKLVTTGACISAKGKIVASQGSGQNVEMHVDELEVLGVADPEKYPLQPKKHSMEFLREIAYLRPRTNTFGAIFRIRHAMIFTVHKFFHDKGFLNVHTPIITASDAEGAGETFHVTTLDLNNVPKTESGEIDYKEDFFAKKTNLTV
ncbi:MAG: asparaginyl-tRNA synthetase, partial [Bacteroidia bacterium]